MHCPDTLEKVSSTLPFVIFQNMCGVISRALANVYCSKKCKSDSLTLKLPGPSAGMGGSLTVTVA